MKRTAQGQLQKSAPPKKPALVRQRSLSNPGTLKRLVPEKKNIDFIQVFNLAPNQGSSGSWNGPVLLNGIATGGSPNQRQGRSVQMKSIQVRLATITTNPQPHTFRVLVVYDKQTNAALPTVAAVLESAVSSESPMNLSNGKRFIVLMDYMTNPTGLTGAIIMDPMQYRKINLPIEFNLGLGATIGDITTGGIYVLITSNQLNAELPRVSFYSRIRYTDL